MHYELLLRGEPMNAEKYCNQLDQLRREKRSEPANRRGVVFHLDIARRRVSRIVRLKLLQFAVWDALPQPPYLRETHLENRA